MMADDKAQSPDGDAYLLTPGPLTTSTTVKRAMLHDMGSRDVNFIGLNRRVCRQLLDIVDACDSHDCVPLPGSGTFAVEAMLATMLPAEGKLLNLVNGAYGRRINEICHYLGRAYQVQETAEDVPVDPVALDRVLSENRDITHVSVVYCETTSGILNPLQEIAEVVARHGRALLIDAMSGFGALPLSTRHITFSALAASSNKCLQGVPGMGFCLIRREALAQCAGHAHSLSLDLYAQAQALKKNGQWRFTPPVQCLLALAQALDELNEEGGVRARGRRYLENCRVLTEGMRAMGFRTLLSDALQAPIIVTFHMPDHSGFNFQVFFNRLSARGYIIYPGKITHADTFRIGCIGALGVDEMRAALAAVKATLEQMGIDHLNA